MYVTFAHVRPDYTSNLCIMGMFQDRFQHGHDVPARSVVSPDMGKSDSRTDKSVSLHKSAGVMSVNLLTQPLTSRCSESLRMLFNVAH